MFWRKITPKEDTIDHHRGQLGKIEIKDFYIYLANVVKILVEDYGFKKSANLNLPVDKDDKPLPLYTYPAIEYLNSLNFKNKFAF